MTGSIDQFKEHFYDIAKEVQYFVFYVRGREFQEESITKLDALLIECTKNKDRAIFDSAENEANAFLAFEFMAKALIEEFKFCLALKNDDPDSGWDHLIDAQHYAADAMKSHDVAAHLDEYAKRLEDLEKSFFPRLEFFSAGYIVQESKCSICGSEYGECDHIRGRPYMGHLCARVITRATLRETSIVADPADKHCRTLRFKEAGVWRNALTYRIVKDEDG